MSCSNYPSTINIIKTDQKCDANCLYSYDYNPTSSCSVISKSNYLEIQTDGSDYVKFNGVNMSVSQVRMYRPSIHLFNGSVADAEIIIQHFGNGKNFLVCIPIEVNDGSGPSNLFFKQIMPFIPVTKNKKQVINVNKWSLNQILNYGSPYYYYLGAFPYEPCNGKPMI